MSKPGRFPRILRACEEIDTLLDRLAEEDRRRCLPSRERWLAERLRGSNSHVRTLLGHISHLQKRERILQHLVGEVETAARHNREKAIQSWDVIDEQRETIRSLRRWNAVLIVACCALGLAAFERWLFYFAPLR